MSDSKALAASMRHADELFRRYLAGFDDENRVDQAEGLPNHASWTLGHVSVSLHRAADLILGFNEPQHLPTEDWVHGDGTAGDPSRYDTESVCFGSIPRADAKAFPRWQRAVAIYGNSVEKIAGAIDGASQKMIEREVNWGKTPTTCGLLVTRQVMHLGLHCGQLVDLRRALGMGRVVG